MKKKLIVLSGSILGFAPLVVLAQNINVNTANTRVCATVNPTIGDFLCTFGNLLNKIIPILIILGVVYFIWGVITYVVGGDEEAKKEGRTRIIYGLIGLAVIIGMWGLVRAVANTLGVDNSGSISVPTISGY